MTKSEELKQVQNEVEKCTCCELAKTRHNTVFSDGNPETAKAILIGEAPGENEDLLGKPFVGRAGKLLNEFLIQAGIDREQELYSINTVKCRPPKNRVPYEYEKKVCEKYLLKQIEIINPKVLIFCGATALKSFYKEKITISKIRGQWIKILNRQAIAIFHPSYLLRNHSIEENSPRSLMLKDLENIKNHLK